MNTHKIISFIEKALNTKKYKTKKYIEQKMKELALNIDEFHVNEIVIDSDGSKCKIIEKTINTIRIFKQGKISYDKKGKEIVGVDSQDYVTMQEFNKRFKKYKIS